MSLFHSNLRKQIRKLPKILRSVKIIQYYSDPNSILFIRVLTPAASSLALPPAAGETSCAADDIALEPIGIYEVIVHV